MRGIEVNEERASLLVECEECKRKFEITADEAANSLFNKKEYKVDGESAFLTYYDCPCCGKRHCVQVDDRRSLRELKEVANQFTELFLLRKKGKEISQKQSAKFKKTRQHLSDYRTSLMEKYTGKLVHDNDTDSDFVLRFSI